LQQTDCEGLEAGLSRAESPDLGHDFSRIPIDPPAAGVLQAKLAINEPGDVYEHEADCVADQVLAASASSGAIGAPPSIQRFGQSAGRSVRQANGQMDEAPASVDQTLASPGRPLEPALRQDMEQRFGYDFSRVRVHSDAVAEQSARDVNAHAYTVGHNLVFGAGRFVPRTQEGLRLIAHELTHVVQQTGRWGLPIRRDARGALARQPDKEKTTGDPNIALSRELAKKLRDGKRADVLATIKGLADKDRDALEVAATQALDKPQADDLRRIIRFVRHKPPTGVTPEPFTVDKEGNLESKAGAGLGKSKTVEVHTDVSVKSKAGDSKEAYTLTYTGADAAEMHWLQFIWREIAAEFPPKTKGGKPRVERLAKPLEHSGRKFGLTTDPTLPMWNTDAGSKASPFYEDNTTVNRSSGSLAMADFPGSMASDAQDIFKNNAASPPTRVVSRFHAVIYLVRNMDVLYRAQIEITWEFKSQTGAPVRTVTAKGAPADRIDAVQHARLAVQDPNVDFLPGPAADPLGEFFALDDQSNAKWADPSAKDTDKYKDIIATARAGWINAVSGVTPSDTINVAASKKDVKPGLNFLTTSGSEAGETGYIDAKGAYHNPDLPIDADTDPLPRIAVILTNNAFSRDKDWALETLRHELRHATHEQLTIAWLQKWREGGAGKLFKDWILAQKKAKKISEADYALVTTGLNLSGSGSDVDLAPTEVLAYTEGIITALPFLPPTPDLALIALDKYPASIRGLKQGSRYFDAATAEPVRKSALKQIHDSCCALGKCDALVAWIDFLVDPAAAKPSTATEKQTVTMVTTDFKSKDFIKKVRTSVKKPC